MTHAIRRTVAPTDGSKPIWRRSSVGMAAVLIALREVAPDTPWWGFLILATVTAVVQQVLAPSVPRKDLPR